MPDLLGALLEHRRLDRVKRAMDDHEKQPPGPDGTKPPSPVSLEDEEWMRDLDMENWLQEQEEYEPGEED